VFFDLGKEKIFIPYYFSNSSFVNWLINILKSKLQDEDLKLDLIWLEILNQQQLFAVRFLEEKEKINIHYAIDTILWFKDSYKSILPNEKISDKIDFYEPKKWSFVITFGLPDTSQILQEYDINNLFTKHITKVLNWEVEETLDDFNKENLKGFLWSLKRFAKVVLWQAEIYSVNQNGLDIVAEKISQTKRQQILHDITEIEKNLNKPEKIDKLELAILWLEGWERFEISNKAKFIWTFDKQIEVEFRWSKIKDKDFKIIEQKKAQENEDIILKNVEYIKLKDYYRILNAEI